MRHVTTRRSARALGFVILLATGSPAAGATSDCRFEDGRAPATRAEWLDCLRLEKSRTLGPYQAGLLERTLRSIEEAERPSIFEWHAWGFSPRIQGIASGSRNAFGVRFWQPEIAPSLDVHASAFYSLNGYEFYDAQVGRIPHARRGTGVRSQHPLRSTTGDDVFELGTLERVGGGDWSLFASARYQHYTRLNYFGSGIGARIEDETTYLGRDALFEVNAGYQPTSRFRIDARFGLLRPGIGRGESPDDPATEDVFDETTAPGLTEQPEFWKFTSFLVFDTRDQPGNPSRGAFVAFEFSRFSDRDDGRFSFSRYGVDARAFLPLGSPQRTLAVRSYTVWDDVDAGARVPFYLQHAIGGSHTLRGFENFRFRGESVALFQAEYRWEAVPAIELAAFVDTGTVGRTGDDFDLGDLRTDWGFGMRLKTEQAYVLRLDWAKSDEDTRFYVRFSPSW